MNLVYVSLFAYLLPVALLTLIVAATWAIYLFGRKTKIQTLQDQAFAVVSAIEQKAKMFGMPGPDKKSEAEAALRKIAPRANPVALDTAIEFAVSLLPKLPQTGITPTIATASVGDRPDDNPNTPAHPTTPP